MRTRPGRHTLRDYPHVGPGPRCHRRWRGRRSQGRGAAGAPAQVRRLVVPQGQAGPRRGRRGRPPSARSPRRPASRSGSGCRCRRRPTCSRRPRQAVHYWAGHVVGDHDVSTYQANDEIDDVGWVPLDEAAGLLSYRDDRDVLGRPRDVTQDHDRWSVLRHAKALSRKQLGRRRPRAAARPTRAQAQAKSLIAAAGGVRHHPGASPPPAPAACRPCSRTPTSTCSTASQTVALSEEHVDEDAVQCAARRPARGHRSRPSCAPTGRCCRVLLDAPRRRRSPARPGGVAGRAPPQGGDPRRGARTRPPDLRFRVTSGLAPRGTVAKPCVSVHLSFTGTDGSRHLAFLGSGVSVPLRTPGASK